MCPCTRLFSQVPVVQSAKKRKKSGGGGAAEDAEVAAAAAPQSQTLTAQSYTPPDPGPYPQDKPPENSVRFTPVQVCFSTSIVCFSTLMCLLCTGGCYLSLHRILLVARHACTRIGQLTDLLLLLCSALPCHALPRPPLPCPAPALPLSALHCPALPRPAFLKMPCLTYRWRQSSQGCSRG